MSKRYEARSGSPDCYVMGPDGVVLEALDMPQAEAIAEVLNAAVAAERERCAAMLDAERKLMDPRSVSHACYGVAAHKVRALSSEVNHD